MFWCAPNMQLDEAEDELESLLGNDPLNLEAMINLGRIFYLQRRFDLAAEMMQAILDSNPNYGNAWILLAFVREQTGMNREALAAYQRWAELAAATFAQTWVKAIGQIMDGDRGSAARAAWKMAWMARFAPVPLAGFVADLFMRLEDHEKALDWLEKAHKEHAIRLISAAADPAFDSLRSHPRFIRLIAAIAGDADQNPNPQSDAVMA
jgi:tetratricopeptide (TPR) repeat protein